MSLWGAAVGMLLAGGAAGEKLPPLEVATAHPHFTVRFPAGWSRTTGWEYRNAARPEEQIIIAFDEPQNRLGPAEVERLVKAAVDSRFEVMEAKSKAKVQRPYREPIACAKGWCAARGGGVLPGLPATFHFRLVADAARLVTVSVYSYASKPAADFDARAKQILDSLELTPEVVSGVSQVDTLGPADAGAVRHPPARRRP